MKKLTLFGLLLAGACFTGCSKNQRFDGGCPPQPARPQSAPEAGIAAGGCVIPPDDPCAGNCEDVVCTQVFAQVLLQVNTAAQAPAVLDSFVVTDMANQPLQLPYGTGNAPGAYLIVNDSWVQGHQNSSMSVKAKGYLGGNLVVDEVLTIGADCCHVSRINGPDSVTLP